MPKKLKLVGAKKYMNPKIRNGIAKGETVVIDDDEIADRMLAETYNDAVNNERPLFVEVPLGEEKALEQRREVRAAGSARGGKASAPASRAARTRTRNVAETGADD